MRVGSSAHRDLFCKSFVDTHRTFEPEELPWPQLDALYLERLRTFPFWSYARSIEQRAGRMVSAFAQTIDAVSGKLSTQALRVMNAAVDLDQQSPAAVARQFLQANGLA